MRPRSGSRRGFHENGSRAADRAPPVDNTYIGRDASRNLALTRKLQAG